jgi:ABC-type glycerol-3-phosphate transport system permease component
MDRAASALALLLALAAVLMLLPFVWMLLTSMRPPAEV